MALRRDDKERNDWRLDAACRGDEAAAFFPPSTFERKEVRLARERIAKSICRECSVRDHCLADALASHEPHGVWGGLNEVERRALLDGRPGTLN